MADQVYNARLQQIKDHIQSIPLWDLKTIMRRPQVRDLWNSWYEDFTKYTEDLLLYMGATSDDIYKFSVGHCFYTYREDLNPELAMNKNGVQRYPGKWRVKEEGYFVCTASKVEASDYYVGKHTGNYTRTLTGPQMPPVQIPHNPGSKTSYVDLRASVDYFTSSFGGGPRSGYAFGQNCSQANSASASCSGANISPSGGRGGRNGFGVQCQSYHDLNCRTENYGPGVPVENRPYTDPIYVWEKYEEVPDPEPEDVVLGPGLADILARLKEKGPWDCEEEIIAMQDMEDIHNKGWKHLWNELVQKIKDAYAAVIAYIALTDDVYSFDVGYVYHSRNVNENPNLKLNRHGIRKYPGTWELQAAGYYHVSASYDPSSDYRVGKTKGENWVKLLKDNLPPVFAYFRGTAEWVARTGASWVIPQVPAIFGTGDICYGLNGIMNPTISSNSYSEFNCAPPPPMPPEPPPWEPPVEPIDYPELTSAGSRGVRGRLHANCSHGHNVNIMTDYIGSGEKHNNMPDTFTVLTWKKVAE